MINCLAIDDEPFALQQLEKCIESMPFLNLVGKARDSYEAMQLLAQHSVDAIFLDINMPGIDGLSFVRSLTNPPLVVFTTAYAEYAVESYKVDAVDYLLKPFSADDFQRAAFKLLRATAKSEEPESATQPSSDVIFLKSDYQRVRLELDSIRYVESMSEYLRIYTVGERKPITTLLSMRRMEEVLPKERFMRIHRSYIVSLDKIQSVQRLAVNMGENTVLPVGEQYKEVFLEYIEQHSIGK